MSRRYCGSGLIAIYVVNIKAANLPLYFITPHGLRHTYASILLAEGVSPVYVQEQLGHATIELTVSTYGRWLKKKAPGALDRLDSVAVPQSGSKVVAEGAFAVGGVGTPSAGVPYIQALKMEPAIRIERTTCGLRRPEPGDSSNTESPPQSSEPDDTSMG